jgi:CRP-like cAMP-binding protein
MYIIRTGRVRITIAKEGREVPITELGKGSFVGEMSLISGIPRTATVTVIETVYANVIHPEVFEHGIYGIPDWIQSIARTLVERIRKTTMKLSGYIAAGDVPAIEPPDSAETVIEGLEINRDAQHNRLLLQGFFSEASINAVKRALSDRLARSDAPLVLDFAGVIDIDRAGVRYLRDIARSSHSRKGRIRFANVQLIYNRLSELHGISSLIEKYRMPIRSLAEGELLIREGEIERSMYVVRSGTFEIVRDNGEGEPLSLSSAEAGDVIGEMALIREGTRSASVRASASASVYVVDAAKFFHGAYGVPEWFMAVIRGLISRLRTTNEMLSELSQKKQDEPVQTDDTLPLSITVDAVRPGYLRLSGNCTFENLDFLAAVIRRCMYKGQKHITIDTRGVEQMDRQSIRYILDMYHALKQGGGDLKLIGDKRNLTWLYTQKGEEAALHV